jgi:hypothetical protein
MDPDEREQLNRVVDHEVKEHFPPGAVRRAILLRHGDEPDIEPGQSRLRVFVPAQDAADEQALEAWRNAHRSEVDELRSDISRRLPSARLLEFTFDGAGPDAPFITVPDDGSQAGEQLSAREIVTKALELLRANYVFPEQAEQAATAIEARLAAGEYDNLDEIALTDLVTEHLQEETDDRHLALRLGGGPQPRARPEPEPGKPRDREARRLARLQKVRLGNFGIHRVERLDGNVGYIDLRGMAPPQVAGPAITAAMELVAGTYALIIDARRNGGGAPDGVVFWCSYLVDERPTHFNDIFNAETGETRQFWSLPYVPGTRYLDRPVYVLTSHRTFSGGEDLCYTLQAAKRAEIIGETTGGGAHPTRGFRISAAVSIAVPHARSISPVTGSNWQGTGVIPDVAVPAEQARDVAYARALRHVLAMDDDVPPPILNEAREALETNAAAS